MKKEMLLNKMIKNKVYTLYFKLYISDIYDTT